MNRQAVFSSPGIRSLSDFRGCVAEWDASRLDSITADGGSQVTTWADVSGNGNDATKPAGLNAPKTGQETQNGLNVITFARSNLEWLEANGVVPIAASTYSLAYVIKVGDISAVSFVCVGGFHTAAGGNAGALFPNNDGAVAHAGQGGSIEVIFAGGLGQDEYHVVVGVYDGTNITHYLDGVRISTIVSAQPFDVGTFNIGQDFDGVNPSDWYEGTVAHGGAFDRILSDYEARTMSAFLMKKWGITIPVWTPNEIIDDIALWLDPSRAITIVKDGSNLVSDWKDRGPVANHVTQSGASEKPLWVDNELNSMPILRAVANEHMDAPDSTFPTVDSNYGIFMVAKNRGDAAGAVYFDTGVASNDQSLFMRRQTSGGTTLETGWFNDSLDAGTVSATAFFVIASLYDNTTGREHYINGASVGTDTQTGRNGATTSHQIWEDLAAVDCDIAEIIVLNNLPSADTIFRLNSYLNTKWGDIY